MDILPYAAALAVFGGILFGIVIATILPYIGVPRVGTALTVKTGVTISTLFWSTWIIPQVILLVVLARPLTITLILTMIYLLYIAGVMLSTYIMGKRGHWDNK